MRKRPLSMLHKIVIGLAFTVFAAAILFICARPQPMGEGLDIGLRHWEQSRR